MALDGWKERLYRQYLGWICRPARLKKRLSALIKEGRVAPPPIDGRRLKVAALQVKITLFKDPPLDYVNEMHRRVEEAAAAGGAHLAAFPEDNNLSLLGGMLPGVEKMGEAVSVDNPQDAPVAADAPAISVADVIRYVGPVIAPLFWIPSTPPLPLPTVSI